MWPWLTGKKRGTDKTISVQHNKGKHIRKHSIAQGRVISLQSEDGSAPGNATGNHAKRVMFQMDFLRDR